MFRVDNVFLWRVLNIVQQHSFVSLLKNTSANSHVDTCGHTWVAASRRSSEHKARPERLYDLKKITKKKLDREELKNARADEKCR